MAECVWSRGAAALFVVVCSTRGAFAEPSAKSEAQRAANTSATASPVTFETPFVEGADIAPAGPVVSSAHAEEIARWNVGGVADPSYVSSKPGFHPAVRVLVNATPRWGFRTSKRGRAARDKKPRSGGFDSVLAQVRNHGYWPFRLCYEAGLRERASLRGESRIRFTLDAKGHIGQARLISTEFSVRDPASCLVKAVKRLRFDVPPARRVDVDLSIKLSPGDVALPQKDPLQTASAELDGGAVQGIASARSAELVACYESALARTPGLWGRIELHLGVDADGIVTEIGEQRSRFPNPEVTACATASLKALRFAPGPASRFVLPVRFGQPPAPAVPPVADDPPAPPAQGNPDAPPAPPAAGTLQIPRRPDRVARDDPTANASQIMAGFRQSSLQSHS